MDVAELGMQMSKASDFVFRAVQTVVAPTGCTMLVLPLLIHDKSDGSNDDGDCSRGVERVADSIPRLGVGLDITPCCYNGTW